MRRGVLIAAWVVLVVASGCDKLFSVTYVDPPAVDAAQPATALVQQQTASAATALTLDATLATAPASGNVLIAIGATDRFYLATPTGGGVTNWIQGASSLIHSNVEVWYGETDGSSSTVTIACACANPGNMRLLVTEWSGLLTKNAVEIRADVAGTTANTAATVSLSTLGSRSLLLFAASVFGSIGSTAMGDGTWSELAPVTVDGATQSAWYQLVDQPGTYTATVPVMGDWDAVIAAFRPQP